MAERNRSGRKSPGWSLVELLMVVTIIGIMALIGPRLMIQVQRFYLQTQSRSAIQRDARESIAIINRFLRQAKSTSIEIDSAASQPPFSRVTFTTEKGQDMVFWQEGGKLYHSIEGKSRMLSENLRFIAFTMPRTDDPTILSVSMTMEKETYERGAKALELTIQKVRVMN